MRNLVIGTAGHIDHGKTTLVKALTGINTDTLKEEQSRGITVNLGFSYLKLDEGHTVGIVDVPGHEKLIKNMLAGVCGLDLILLTIAADDGIMPQTKEHMEIIRFLNVENIIVVITKTDLVDPGRIEEVKQSVRDEFKLNQFVEFSAYKEETTLNVLNKLRQNISREQNEIEETFRLPIDRVFTVKGQGVVVTGSSLSGVVRIGDELEILPTKQKVRVRGIQSFKQPRSEAYKRMRVALNLGGVKKEDINRGKMIATKNVFSPSQIIDVKIKVTDSLAEPIKHLEYVKFYYLASEIKCRVKLINCKQINEGEIVYGQLLLDEAIYASNKDLGVLRRINPIETIAGIEIINVFGEYVNRKDESYKEKLTLFEKNDQSLLVKHYLINHPFIKVKEIKKRLNLVELNLDEVTKIVSKHGIVLEDSSCLTNEQQKDINKQLISLVNQFHTENPHDLGMKKSLCKQELNLTSLSTKAFNQLLTLCDGVRVMNDHVKCSDFSIKYSKEEQVIVDHIIKLVNNSEFRPPKLDELLCKVPGNKNKSKSIYFALIKEQKLIKIEQDIVLTNNNYDRLIKSLDQYFKNHTFLNIKDMRELFDTSRKYIIAYLEYLDQVGYTKRTEEGRVKK